MNTADRAKAITTAIECLHYTLGKLQGGATRYSMARRILDQQSTAVSMGASASGSGSGGMPTSKGTHSDPTCAAAMARLAGFTDEDGNRDHTLANLLEWRLTVIEHAWKIRRDTVRALHDVTMVQGPRTLEQARDDLIAVSDDVARAVVTLRQMGEPARAERIDDAVHTVGAQSSAMFYAVDRTLNGAARKVADKPKQKPLAGCVSCARADGHWEPIDLDHHGDVNMCRVCGDYFKTEGKWLPLYALRYTIRTGKRITSKVLAEAEKHGKRSDRKAG